MSSLPPRAAAAIVSSFQGQPFARKNSKTSRWPPCAAAAVAWRLRVGSGGSARAARAFTALLAHVGAVWGVKHGRLFCWRSLLTTYTDDSCRPGNSQPLKAQHAQKPWKHASYDGIADAPVTSPSGCHTGSQGGSKAATRADRGQTCS